MKDEFTWKMNEKQMPNVEKATHLGLIRPMSTKKSESETVDQNITKARRATYSLMSAGCHGENGLDPISNLHMVRKFVQPILTYGLEIILPKESNSNRLEQFQKKIIKQILPVPQNTPDPAVYVLSGFLPTEAQIEMKALIFVIIYEYANRVM